MHPLTEWTIPAFAFPAKAGTHLPTREGWKAELAWTEPTTGAAPASKTLNPNSLPPNMAATNLTWSEVPLHCWDCMVVIRVWNSFEEFR